MIPALMCLWLGLGLMACISLFFPRAAFFLKNPTRWKAAGSWAALCIITFFIIGFGFKNELKEYNAQSKAKKNTEAVSVANAAAQEQSSTHDLFREPTAEEEKASQERRVRMAQKTPLVQAEIKKLYDELLVMRNTMEFKELGFSGKNKTSNEWKSRVNALSERMKADDDIPVIVKAAPAYLIGLGMEKGWRLGNTTSDSKWNTQMVMDALNWKLEE